jgi:hypothetical protein
MHGIFIAFIVAAAIGLVVGGGFLWRGGSGRERLILAAILASQLPASWFVNVSVKQPLHRALSPLVADRDLYGFLAVWYAPVTEELIKFASVAVAAALGWLAAGRPSRRAVDAAIAAGLGFAIGEMAYIAAAIAQVPAYAGFAWYQFGGYIAERLATCVWHPAFVAVPAAALAKGWRWLPLGLVGAFVLHFLGNFPIYLAGRDAFGLGREGWALALFVWVWLYTVPLGVMLVFLRIGGARPLEALRRAAEGKCRHCGHVFTPGWRAINLGPWRWARCPSCRRMTFV